MEHGKVTSVKYEKGVVVCDVDPVRQSTPYHNVPVFTPFSGMIQMPKEGMKVGMQQLSDDTRLITEVITSEKDVPTAMSPGDFAIQLDKETFLKFHHQDDDTINVELNASGDKTIIAEGDMDIDATGDINISTSGEADVYINGINFENHTHPYVDDEISDTGDGSGTETQQNKTTDPPQ